MNPAFVKLSIRENVANEILSSSTPLRNLEDIILDIAEINERHQEALINLEDSTKLEKLALELIKHARYTAEVSY